MATRRRIEDPNTNRIALTNPVSPVRTAASVNRERPSIELFDLAPFSRLLQTKYQTDGPDQRARGLEAFNDSGNEFLKDLPEDPNARRSELRARFRRAGIRGTSNPFFQAGFYGASGEAVAQEYRRVAARYLEESLEKGAINPAGGINELEDPDAVLARAWEEVSAGQSVTLTNTYGRQASQARRAEFNQQLLTAYDEKRVAVEEEAAKDVRTIALSNTLAEWFTAGDGHPQHAEVQAQISRRLGEEIFEVSAEPWEEYQEVVVATIEQVAVQQGPEQARELLLALEDMPIGAGTKATIANSMPTDLADDWYRLQASLDADIDRERNRDRREREDLVLNVLDQYADGWTASFVDARGNTAATEAALQGVLGQIDQIEGLEDGMQAELRAAAIRMRNEMNMGAPTGPTSQAREMLSRLRSDAAYTAELAKRDANSLFLSGALSLEDRDFIVGEANKRVGGELMTQSGFYNSAVGRIRVRDFQNLPSGPRGEAMEMERGMQNRFYHEFVEEAASFDAANPEATEQERIAHMTTFSNDRAHAIASELQASIDAVEEERSISINALQDRVMSGDQSAWEEIQDLRNTGMVSEEKARQFFNDLVARSDTTAVASALAQDLHTEVARYLPVSPVTNQPDAEQMSALQQRIQEMEKTFVDDIRAFAGNPAERADFIYKMRQENRQALFELFAPDTSRVTEAIRAADPEATPEEAAATATTLLSYTSDADNLMGQYDSGAGGPIDYKRALYHGQYQGTPAVVKILRERMGDVHDRGFFDRSKMSYDDAWGAVLRVVDSETDPEKAKQMLGFAVNNLGVPWRDVIDGKVFGHGKEVTYLDYRTEDDRKRAEAGGQTEHLKVYRSKILDLDPEIGELGINPYIAPFFRNSNEMEAFFDGDFNQGQYAVKPFLEALQIPWDSVRYPDPLEDPNVQTFYSYQLDAIKRVAPDA